MLTNIKRFFESHLMPRAADTEGEAEHRLQLAVAALLLEMTQMDGQVRPEQCARVEAGIRDQFGLTPEETKQLIELAEAERLEATDYFQFTSLIKQHYGPERRVQLVENLWRIAYANKVLHHHEEHLVRKIAELLHVSHGAFIAAKHRSGGDSNA
jgi:uncharacterized tellurite resistance protein B-like protein